MCGTASVYLLFSHKKRRKSERKPRTGGKNVPGLISAFKSVGKKQNHSCRYAQRGKVVRLSVLFAKHKRSEQDYVNRICVLQKDCICGCRKFVCRNVQNHRERVAYSCCPQARRSFRVSCAVLFFYAEKRRSLYRNGNENTGNKASDCGDCKRIPVYEFYQYSACAPEKRAQNQGGNSVYLFHNGNISTITVPVQFFSLTLHKFKFLLLTLYVF